MMSKVQGFTMIELVVVIVLMGIISVAGVEIIRYSAESYQAMTGRQALGNAARLAVDRISRELRNALPDSARVTGTCLEFLPITAGGTYLDIPVEASATSFQAVPMNPGLDAATGRVAVYPLAGNAYDLSSNIMSGTATLGAPDVNNEVQVSLASTHQFPAGSPTNRFFIVGNPVSFCVDGDNLFRYESYGLNTAQPAIAGLPTALPTRALLVNQVAASTTPFDVSPASLQRNAIVSINLVFSDAGETVRMVHEVQLRNVP